MVVLIDALPAMPAFTPADAPALTADFTVPPPIAHREAHATVPADAEPALTLQSAGAALPLLLLLLPALLKATLVPPLPLGSKNVKLPPAPPAHGKSYRITCGAAVLDLKSTSPMSCISRSRSYGLSSSEPL